MGLKTGAIGGIRLPVERLHVELTNRCNFSCEFCPDGRMKRARGSMDFALLEDILSQAEGVARQVHFHVMGEPMLYPRLPAAVRFARRHGLEPWVTTNGSLLSEEAARELEAAGLAHLTVSLQTPDADRFGLRGCRTLSFDEYKGKIVGAIRPFLTARRGMSVTVVFLTNPLQRFLAPDPPTSNFPESARELRGHLERWAREIVAGTSVECELPRILARTRKAGVLKENVIHLTEKVRFRVRVLGNWAEHFELPVVPARIGYCPGLAENFGILWNGDWVICCTDYDGKTSPANVSGTSMKEFLSLPEVQRIAQGFRHFRVVHPYCRVCLGERGVLDSAFRQVGSIFYFKLYRKLLAREPANREAV